jgi:hypothetical protein
MKINIYVYVCICFYIYKYIHTYIYTLSNLSTGTYTNSYIFIYHRNMWGTDIELAFIFCVYYLCLIGRVYVFHVGHVDKSSLYETFFHCNTLSKHHHHHRILS